MPYNENLGPDQCYGVDDGGDCPHCGRSLDNYCDCERCERCGEIIEHDCDCKRCEVDSCGKLLDELNDTGLCPEHQHDDCTAAIVEAEEGKPKPA